MVEYIGLDMFKIFPSRAMRKEIQLKGEAGGCGLHLSDHMQHIRIYIFVTSYILFEISAEQCQIYLSGGAIDRDVFKPSPAVQFEQFGFGAETDAFCIYIYMERSTRRPPDLRIG